MLSPHSGPDRYKDESLINLNETRPPGGAQKLCRSSSVRTWRYLTCGAGRGARAGAIAASPGIDTTELYLIWLDDIPRVIYTESPSQCRYDNHFFILTIVGSRKYFVYISMGPK